MRYRALAALALLASACASGPHLSTGPDGFDPGLYSFNITATTPGILDSPDELSRELDLLIAHGYKRQIRIIAPYWFAGRIESIWLPIIRAKGYKALVILSQGRGEVEGHEQEAMAWAQHVVTAWRDVLIGVQPGNEPWVTDWPIESYLRWHRQVVPIIRAAGLPVVTGDFDTMRYYDGLDWQTEVDVVSLHVTGVTDVAHLKRLASQVPKGKPVWITEGDWSQRTVLPVSESFIYTCDGDPDSKLNRCPTMGGR